MAELDVDMTTDGKRNTLISGKPISFDPHMGIEGAYKNTIFLRLGVGNIQRVLDDKDTTNQKKYTIYQPAVGIGLKIKGLMLDYAFTSLQTQANPLYTHIISLRLDINKKETRAMHAARDNDDDTLLPHREKKRKTKKKK
jgi:hypothetical protein